MRKNSSQLGCVEFAVPGGSLEGKLSILESRGMWLELANDGGRGADEVSRAQESFDVPIRCVQANLLHKLKLLSGDAAEHCAALSHVEETVRMASELGAENVVTTLDYGKPTAKSPRRLALETYRRLGRLAQELGVTVSIEPLGKNRSDFMPGISEVAKLVSEVSSPRVRLMADTMHIHDNGDDVYAALAARAAEISELQLRDTGSKPPGQGKLDFVKIMEKVKEKFRGLLCMEYKPGKNPQEEFIEACDFLADVIAAAR